MANIIEDPAWQGLKNARKIWQGNAEKSLQAYSHANQRPFTCFRGLTLHFHRNSTSSRATGCVHQILLAVLQNLTGLAVEMFADDVKCGEPDSLGLASLEDGQVLWGDAHSIGQVVQPHFPLGENYVKVDDDGHGN